ncbi:uncharacterized protein LOC143281947 [Babylonia areolata]|uniref:uncharacterized protein LOC143281947 n=1 Tax=Babylonia areolata TaxID=304850 RepID=UPI003FD1B61F
MDPPMSTQTALSICSPGNKFGPYKSPQTLLGDCSQSDKTAPCEVPKKAVKKCSQGDKTGPCELPQMAFNESSQGPGDEIGPCEMPKIAVSDCSQRDESESTLPLSPQTRVSDCSHGDESESTLSVSPKAPLSDSSQGDEEQEPQTSVIEKAFKSEEHFRIQQKFEELHWEISTALEERVNQGKNLEPYMDSLLASHDEVRKRLQNHKRHLCHLVELYHEHQMDILKTQYNHLLQQTLLVKTEAMNYEASLADLQNQASDHLVKMERGTEADTPQLGLMTRDLQHIREMFEFLSQWKPAGPVPRQVVTADLPEVGIGDLHGLMGTVDLSEDMDHHSDLPVPGQQCLAGKSWEQLVLGDAPTPNVAVSEHVLDNLTVNTDMTVNRHLHSRMMTSKRRPVLHEEHHATKEYIASVRKKGPVQKKQKVKKGPLTAEKKAQGREMIQSISRDMQATRVSQHSAAQTHQWVSITTPPGSSPVVVSRQGSVPTAIAPMPGGRVWVLYRNEQIMDMLDESGKVCYSTRIGRCPFLLAPYGATDVLVAHGSPKSLMLYAKGQNCYVLFGRFEYKSIAATTSGIAVCSANRVFWVPVEGKMNWIKVYGGPNKLHSFSSLTIMMYKGKHVICVADKRGVVYFFQQETSDTFTAYPPFGFEKGMKSGSRKQKKRPFTPVCVSCHPTGFLAVLDAASDSVYIINTRKMFESGLTGSQCVTSVISADKLCCGVPLLIAFAVGDREEEDPKLWVGTKSELCLTPLIFLPW